MTFFADPGTDEKYYGLGFLGDNLSLKIMIGNVSIRAFQHPLMGVALMFESIGPLLCANMKCLCRRCAAGSRLQALFTST
jgi:hypothetical protein